MKGRRQEEKETQIFPELISSQTMQDLNAVQNEGLSEHAFDLTELKLPVLYSERSKH